MFSDKMVCQLAISQIPNHITADIELGKFGIKGSHYRRCRTLIRRLP